MKNFTVILSLENKKNGLEKVWKKSWILFTKKCTNPDYDLVPECENRCVTICETSEKEANRRREF